MKEIRFGGMNTTSSIAASTAGDLALSIGLINENNELHTFSPLGLSYNLPTGFQLIGAHQLTDSLHLIMYHNSSLYWADYNSTDILHRMGHIAAGESKIRLASANDHLWITDTQGLSHYQWIDNDYLYLGNKIPFPTLKFGMVRAGNLSLNEAFSIPSFMACANNGTVGNGATIVHSTSTEDSNEAMSAAGIVHKAIDEAIAQQIEGAGYFYQPFFVRYALRMTGGQHQCLSSPILILPWVLPPCITIYSETSNNDSSVTVRFSGTSFPFFRLTCHVQEPLSEEWKGHIEGVDVYISTPIYTYNRSRISTDGITSYAQLVQNSSLSPSISLDNMFAGIWSEDGTSFVEHTFSELGLSDTRAWPFLSNPSFTQQVADNHEFWKVGFIPFSLLTTSSDIEFNINSTQESSIKKGELLIDDFSGHSRCIPNSILCHNGNLFTSGGRREIPSPLPYVSMVERCNDSTTYSTILSVRVRQGGKDYQVSATCNAPDIESCRPRYLFCSIPGSYSMSLIQTDKVLTIPLTPHSYLEGSYWWSTLKENSLAVLPCETEVSAPTTAWIDDVNLLQMFDTHQALVSTSHIGSGKSIGLSPTFKTMSQGQFGQYTLYVFNTDGVWTLPVNSKGFGTPQIINQDKINSELGILSTPYGVVYTTNHEIKLLNGAKYDCLSHPIRRAPMQDWSLPHISTILSNANITEDIPSLKKIMEAPHLSYDEEYHRFWIWNDSYAFAFVYSFESEKWTMSMKPDSTSQYYVAITQPFSFEDFLTIIKICGVFAGNQPQMYLFGSPDLNGWTLIASVRSTEINPIFGTQYRYYALAIITSEGSYLSSILHNFPK